MKTTEVFAAALKHYRGVRGMSQEELAIESDLDRTYISQLERGLKSPTLNTLDRLAACLSTRVSHLLREPAQLESPRVPGSYSVRSVSELAVVRKKGKAKIPSTVLVSAVNLAHEMIDDLYGIELDIATVLGMRNLSAFIGELFASAVVKCSKGLFTANPHQDGYPDLLLMDSLGLSEWNRLSGYMNEKSPFSPFVGGGVEVKATCGSVPTPKQCRDRGIPRPALGDSRIGCLMSYDWKAHHRETNNLVGLLWDFIGARPRIAAVFYSSALGEHDWGKIVRPKTGGGRTTSVSIMGRSGISKMYEGWLCVLRDGGYREFLNKRNRGDLVS